MKEKIYVILKPIVFLIIFAFLVQRFSLALQVYGSAPTDPNRRTCLFFSLPKNTVDVLFTGTSRAYASYIPQQIYDNTGISSAVLATSMQSCQNTYWLLKEALQRQSPELVIMDVHRVATPVDKSGKEFRMYYTSGISVLPDLSINKIRAYRDIASDQNGWAKEMTVYDAYSFLEYKNIYDRGTPDFVSIANLLINPISEYKTFGYFSEVAVQPLASLQPSISSSAYVDLKQTTDFLYLEKIVALLRDKDIPLLLVRAPYDGSQFDDLRLYSQAFEWIEEQQIPFIDFFRLIREIGIDPATDFYDKNHMNYLGAKKVTTYMEGYLQEHYALEDHRGDSKYELWERSDYNYEDLEKQILKQLGR